MKNRFALLMAVALLAPISNANQNPQTQAANTQTASTQTTDTQTASTQATENQNNNQAQANQTQAPIPANPHDPANGTYLQSIMPDDSQLSKVNTELLATNTNLVRQVESLNTQVNVLVQERTNQLFIYGGLTAIVSFVLGFVLAKLTSRQGRW